MHYKAWPLQNQIHFYYLSKDLLISAAQHLHMTYNPLSIDNHIAKVNAKYAIYMLEVMTTFLDLRNLQKLYRISLFLLTEKTYLLISDCLICERNLKSFEITTKLIEVNLFI